jgi:hypothetical protein
VTQRVRLSLLIFFCYSIFSTTDICLAGVDLPWSTTFNCPDWTQGQLLSCDGLATGGDWTCNGAKTQITSDANHANGDSGKGVRFYIGDGSNVGSGNLLVKFNTPQKEFWIRWYMRYHEGFKWNNISYDKILYIYTSSTQIIPIWYGWDGFSIGAQNTSNYHPAKCTGCGWITVMQGSTGDGRWHCYELHIKVDANSSDGVGELWIDGQQVISQTNVDWSNGEANARQGVTHLLFNSNQSSPNNGKPTPVDFDDIAVSDRGYIGPTNNFPSAIPAPPIGLRILG